MLDMEAGHTGLLVEISDVPGLGPWKGLFPISTCRSGWAGED